MFRNSILRTMLSLSVFMLFGCSGGEMNDQKKIYSAIKDVPESTWKRLAEKRIYFGHQSVGFNIIDGMKDVMKENPQIKLNVVEAHDPGQFNGPVFAHSSIGRNQEPISKCDAFAGFLEKGLGSRVDIAFFKFCFVDVTASTNVDSLFAEYKKTITRLKEKYPKITLVHITVPLMTVQTGVKVWIKQIIGRPIGGYDDNARRGEFNDRLRAEYQGRDAIYDLAAMESTLPDGSTQSFEKDGKVYQALVPEYTNDGGHLNERGRKLAAERLMTLLANLSQ